MPRASRSLSARPRIEKSEFLSELLKKEGIPHNVLNARQHEQEAQIVADAGKFGAVTIATNMAGRGTDIQLGGNVEMKVLEAIAADPHLHPDEVRARIEAEHAEEKAKVKAAGGLFVLATERHESRRIDNQLRGRSGRQGDPGRSSFFLSLEDDLMRIFGSERLDKVLSTLGMKEGEAIVHPWVNKSLEKAQAKVEGRNFDIRKQLAEVRRRDERPAQGDLRPAAGDHGGRRPVARSLQDMRHQVIDDLVDQHLPPKSYADQWDTEGLHAACREWLGLDLPVAAWAAEEGVDQDGDARADRRGVGQADGRKGRSLRPRDDANIEKQLLLQTIDGKWREHLLRLEHLRSVVGFRGYAQRDPLNEYKTEAFQLFESMLNSLRQDVTQKLSQVRPMTKEEQDADDGAVHGAAAGRARRRPRLRRPRRCAGRSAAELAGAGAPARAPLLAGFDEADPSTWGNPGRNDPCPCGSGEKFKHCHGKIV